MPDPSFYFKILNIICYNILMRKVFWYIREYKSVVFWSIVLLGIAGAVQYYIFDRTLFGPSNTFGWWSGDINSSENSQRLLDAYSFSHVIHGLLFYLLLWIFAKRLDVKKRFYFALILEVIWELFENSSFIINRYREGTIAQGYFGDSVLNSLSDCLMMIIGFILARISKIWKSFVLFLLMELGCLYWIRDNLTLNIIMLVHPIQEIKDWQSKK